MAFNILPLKTLASFEAAKLFWKASSFKIEDLQLNELHQVTEPNWDIKLRKYREEAIGCLNAFIENRKLPHVFKTPLTKNILLLQKAYHKLILWKLNYDPDNNIDLLQKGELYAPNYFTIDGEFNDFVWVKRFVLYPNCLIIERFSLSCSFWFEKECEILLRELKELYRFSFGENIDLFQQDFLCHFGHNSSLIQLWLLQLENKLKSPYQELAVQEGFWQISLNHTVKKGYEHAVYFIWQKLSDFEKYAITHSDRFFELLCFGMDYPRDNISYFLFSKLSDKRKGDFFNWTIHSDMQIYNRDKTEIWLILLLPLYANEFRSEILEFIFQLPINMFSNLLQSLSHRLKKFKLPLDAEMFQFLWSKLSSERKHDVLERGTFIIQNLLEAKSFFNLDCIIKGLSFEKKKRCLLHGLYGAGIDGIDILQNELDLLQKYLTYFLIDFDSNTEKQTLRKESISLLKMFLDSSDFKKWRKYKLGAGSKYLVKVQIDTLHTSATLLHELCEKVSEEMDTLQSPSNVNDLKM